MQIDKACCEEGANNGGYVGGNSCRCKWLWHPLGSKAGNCLLTWVCRFLSLSEDEVLIATTRSGTCPVAMLECYIERTGIRCNDQCFLFCAIQNTKRSEILRQSGKISYTCMNDLYNKKLTSLGFSAAEFGLHSLRSGGATTAANAGVPDRLFKRHGRWKSENAKDGYVKDSIESRLQVSKKLGPYLIIYSFLCSSKLLQK